MKSFAQDFNNVFSSFQTEPRFCVKIYNQFETIFITSDEDVDTGFPANTISGNLVSLTSASQSVTPEKGFSTLGNITFSALESELTEKMRTIFNTQGDTLYNNKVEILAGDKELAFSQYEIIDTQYLDTISNNETSYQFSCKDVQKYTRETIFTPSKAYLYDSISSTDETLTTLKVTQNIQGFDLVQHDGLWGTDPNRKIGYFAIKGVNDENGEDVTEIFSFTSKSGDTFSGVERHRFNTGSIAAVGGIDLDAGQNPPELIEIIYLNMASPKMLLALLTGDLYNQGVETIPSNWNMGLSSVEVDIDSFINISPDLWDSSDDTGLPMSFLGIEEQRNAKTFISQQILRFAGLMLITSQSGKLTLRRFGAPTADASAVRVYDERSLISVSSLTRDSSAMHNQLVIDWDWSYAKQSYTRKNVFIDAGSIERNNQKTPAYNLKLNGLTNVNRQMQDSMEIFIRNLMNRFVDPPLRRTVSIPMAAGYDLEVGDMIKLNLANFKDFTQADNEIRTYEIQSVSADYFSKTISLSLFGTVHTSDEADLFDADASLVTIDHAGWVDILTLANVNLVSGDAVVTAAAQCANNVKYYHNGGDIVVDGGVLQLTGTNWLDAKDVYVKNGGLIDGVARATEDYGYLGSSINSTAGAKINMSFYAGQSFGTSVNASSVPTKYYDSAFNTVSPLGVSNIARADITLNDSNVVYGVPPHLSGYKGAQATGGSYSYYSSNAGGGSGSIDGPEGALGGAGLVILCEGLFLTGGSIDLSGANGTDRVISTTTTPMSNIRYATGASGGGYGGCLLVAHKDRSNAFSFINNGEFSSVIGTTETYADFEARISPDNAISDDRFNITSNSTNVIVGENEDNLLSDISGIDVSAQALYVTKIKANTVSPESIDTSVKAPSLVTLTEQVDTPQTTLGDRSTIIIDVVKDPTDDNFSYSPVHIAPLSASGIPLDIRVKPKVISATRFEFEVKADGATYEVTAFSYNKNGLTTAGAFTTNTITVRDYRSTQTTDLSQENQNRVAIPAVRSLSLKNRIAPSEFNKFKSGNAEFRWAVLSATQSFDFTNEDLNAGAGSRDPHLDGYQVRVYTSGGILVREEYVFDESYIYTLEKNKVDGTGRNFKVTVASRGTNNQIGEPQEINVSNPASTLTNVSGELQNGNLLVTYDRPTDIDFIGVRIKINGVLIDNIYTDTSITVPNINGRSVDVDVIPSDEFGDGSEVSFNVGNPAPDAVTSLFANMSHFNGVITFLPPTNDIDYIGVNFRYKEVGGAYGSSAFYNTNSINIEGLNQNTQYEFEVTSVDTIGVGSVTSIVGQTLLLEAADVDGLSNWATETDPVDLAFINANMGNDAVPSTKIGGVVAGKIEAGQVDVTVDIGTGVRLDGANGLVRTVNTGYEVTMGAVSVPAESANPLVLFANDGVNYPFWIDAAGSFQFGTGEKSITFNSVSGDMEVGEDTNLIGVDAYSNESIYRHIQAIDYYTQVVSGNGGTNLVTVDNSTAKHMSVTFDTSGSQPYFAFEGVQEDMYSLSGIGFSRDYKLKCKLGKINTLNFMVILIGSGYSSFGDESTVAISLDNGGTGIYFRNNNGTGTVDDELTSDVSTVDGFGKEHELIYSSGDEIELFIDNVLVCFIYRLGFMTTAQALQKAVDANAASGFYPAYKSTTIAMPTGTPQNELYIGGLKSVGVISSNEKILMGEYKISN